MVKKEPKPEIVVKTCLETIYRQLENLIRYCVDKDEIKIEKYSYLIGLLNFLNIIMEEFK